MRLDRCWLWVCALAVGWVALAADPAEVAAQAGLYGRHRLIHRFDFEEAHLNNFEEMPIHWFAIGRPADTANPNFKRQPLHQQMSNVPGYPAYTHVRFDVPQHKQGQHRLYLGLNGGNAGAYIEVGALPAVPQSDYLVTAWVSTDGVERSRAQLRAYFVDAHGERIDNSVSTSAPVNTQGEWRRISVKLHGDHDRAAWIGLEAHLIQPKPSGPLLGEHQVVYKDVRGQAWFDDISVWQVPRLMLRTQQRSNVVRAPRRPELQMQVRDLMGRSLTARVTVYDHKMRQVAVDEHPIGGGTPNHWRWRPPLEQCGWFKVDMTVREPLQTDPNSPSDDRSTDVAIARMMTSFIWLPEEPPMDPDDAQRFTLLAEDINDDELEIIPELMQQVDLESTVLSAWDQDTTRQDIGERQALLDALINTIISQRRQVGLSLSPVPKELAEQLEMGTDSPLSMFIGERRQLWDGYLTPVLMTHGQRVRRWQLGTPKLGEAFYFDELPSLMRNIGRLFREIAPTPQIMLPWKLYQSRHPGVRDVPIYILDVPAAVPPHALEQYTQEWAQDPNAEFHLHLREPTARWVGHDDRVDDLAQRMVHGWNTGAAGLALSRPWTGPLARGQSLNPDPLLSVFTTVAHRLAGRRQVGTLPVHKGVTCLIFDGPAGGMLVAWNESAQPRDAAIKMYLGAEPRAIDIWGNRLDVEASAGQHQVQLGTKPLFIEGIDPALALLRSSFKVDPPFIESTVVPHRRELTLTNPWPKTISGRLRVVKPQNWTIVPREHHFSIAPSQKIQLPLQLQFPASEVAGDKHVVAHLTFTADERYEVDLYAPIELGLPGIEFDATLTIEDGAGPGQLDAVVTNLITNTGDKSMALYAFGGMRGYPRQERIIAQLQPGQSVIRRFRFPDAADKLTNTPIRVGVRESTGPAVLNKVLSVDDL